MKQKTKEKRNIARVIGTLGLAAAIAFFYILFASEDASQQRQPESPIAHNEAEDETVNDTPPRAEVDLESQNETKPPGQADATTVFADDIIELPDPFSDTSMRLSAEIMNLTLMEFYQAEDKIVAEWPRFDEVREDVLQKLRDMFNLEELTEEELIQHAVELREKFWQAGGRMSPGAFQDIYAARVLLEIGHERYPENLAIIDELVETIQSTWPTIVYGPLAKEEANLAGRTLPPNIVCMVDFETNEELLVLRQKQFSLIEGQIRKDRKPDFQDFLRVCDLGQLYRVSRENREPDNITRTSKMVSWLQENADDGGWSFYQQSLDQWQRTLAQGGNLGMNVFVSRNRAKEHPGQFSRRLPSFRGPASRDLFAAKDAYVLGGTVRTGSLSKKSSFNSQGRGEGP